MGKKRKKDANKRRKNNNTSKKQKKKLKKKYNKYKSRRDMLLDNYPECVLDIMFDGDKDAIKKFGDYLVKVEDFYNDEQDQLLMGPSIYDEKIEKLQSKKVGNINDMIVQFHEIGHLNRKIAKNDFYNSKSKSRDLSIASYLNDKRYKKKFLDKNKYRKHMKKIAKAEQKELKEMKKLGYIKSDKPDKELNKLKLNSVNEKMMNALSDAYTQKHFI